MANLKCPHCGHEFMVDDSELGSVLSQIRDEVFESDLEKRIDEMEKHLQEKHDLVLKNRDAELRAELQQEYEEKLEIIREELRKEQDQSNKLRTRIESQESEKKIAVLEAVQKVEREKQEIEKEKQAVEKNLSTEKEKSKILLDEKEKEIALYKDMKTRMSTKMVGESLEQHCADEFNKIRMTAFPRAFFPARTPPGNHGPAL